MTAGALLAALPVLTPTPSAAASADEASLTEGQRALAQAERTGERVEVTGQRSQRTTVYANPDGFTFTLEESAVPVRVPTADGGWRAPDAALEKRSDGSVAPKAAAVDMEFSGGGDKAPLARIDDQGRALELAWPGTLPVPELDGTSALYADVLPGVDLKVTATPESFQPVFVVRTPEAAAGDELKKLTFGLKAEGLIVREGAVGNLIATDGDGRRVFRAPPARMWDSAGAASGTQTQLMTAETASADDAESSDTSESAPSGSGLEPGQGDAVARMEVDVTEDSLTVVPDTEMLSATPETAFPVFIDPTVSWGESERTLLRSDGYESYGWGNGSDDNGKGAGKCGTWNGYYCGPGYVQRLYFEFSPASLKGKKILDATFRVTEPWAFQCDPRWVDLVRTSNISSSTTWSSRPRHLDLMVDRNVSAGRGSLCDPDSPDAPIEFKDHAPETNENLTPTVADFAAGKFDRLTLMIKAHDETDTAAWKRFRNDATLAVDFVGLPDKPSGIGLNVGGKPVCESSSSNPQVLSSPTPTLMATARTKPGGEKDAQLRVYFDIDRRGGDGTWSDAPAGNGDLRPSTGYVGDDAKVSMVWSTLTEGTLYRYRAWVRSYYNKGADYLAGPSNASTTGWCYFKVDPTRPKAPVITFDGPYSECTTNDCAAKGGPGVEGSFTFSPAAGDAATNTAYQYKLSSGDAWSPPVHGSTVSVHTTPEDSGTHRLYVRARDSIDWGAQSVVDFLVDAGPGPVGRWHFSEASGAARDSATADGGDDLSLSGGAVRDDRGRRGLMTHDATGTALQTPVTDKGLTLDGSTGYAATSGPVLETRASYTVSAWARVKPGASGTQTVLGQDGDTYSPFYLSYQSGYWSLRLLSRTGDSSTWHTVRAKAPGTEGVWTHVAGTFDASVNKLRLYVNGVLQGEADAGTSWSANGPLQVGRVKYRGNHVDYFDGQIDEVAVWQTALKEAPVADEARLSVSEKYAAAELVADWSAERGSGSSIPDTTSGYGRSLTLTGGASLDGESIVLDGVDDAAATSRPIVDDTGSFTVTTLASLDGDKLAAKSVGYRGQVLGQRTADGSAWGFWYELKGKQSVWDDQAQEEKTVPVGFWRFGRLNADGTFSAVASDTTALTDGLVRLTGIFDAQVGTISLYVGGVQNGDASAFTAKAASGDFAVGKGFVGGAWGHYLPGQVAEIRLWAGAMASPEQVEVRVGD
ncbi:LamG domain-containing protein [Streptomyces sp. TRM68416]|nr:LamG domain-containing protein [Streptomyces sp. TRM68416]